MPSTAESIHIDASCEQVFDLLHDYSRRLAWDPFLRRADVLGQEAGRADGCVKVGTRTWCAARWRNGGLGMETVYVTFRRPDVAAVRMTRGPWFIRLFGASIRHVQEGSGCRVTYRFTFEAAPQWLAPLMRPVFRRFFERETRGRLEALKRYAEGTDEREGERCPASRSDTPPPSTARERR
ncbi:MAG TPA: SRPBCC family protein [Candidatus Kapabacteria bacterium]|nr:SRPBCC family protein [Candidatus Kapabacteria bacterium]